jgi:hypothetical protein
MTLKQTKAQKEKPRQCSFPTQPKLRTLVFVRSLHPHRSPSTEAVEAAKPEPSVRANAVSVGRKAEAEASAAVTLAVCERHVVFRVCVIPMEENKFVSALWS